MTEVPEEDVKEGDVDWLVAAAVLLDLTQHHLTGNRKWRVTPWVPGPRPLLYPPQQWWWRWRSYLDAAGQHAGGHLLVEAGVLVAVHHYVAQLRQQQQVGAVFVQRLDQHVLGAQPTHHHRIVLVDRRQAAQEVDQVLHHLGSKGINIKLYPVILYNIVLYYIYIYKDVHVVR